MSFYATLEGEITYPNKESFDSVVSLLVKGGWVKDNQFVDEMGDVIGFDDGDFESIEPRYLTITIPRFLYRNMSRIDFFCKGAKGYLVGTSTDGCFEAWTIVDGVETNYNLDQWAKENIDEKQPDDDEARIKWAEMVQDEFIADHAA